MTFADDLSRQSRTLFANLPADEVGDDEPLNFRTDTAGRLMVKTERAGYHLIGAQTYRYRVLEDGTEEISVWENGEQVHRALVRPEVGRGNPELN
jgi:hypothetical protein